MEVNRVERANREALNKVEGVDSGELQTAKVGFGAVVGEAIGDNPDKTYGDKSWISNVKAGPGVPDYLARIWADRRARRRMALALLKNDDGVRVRLTVECEWDDA